MNLLLLFFAEICVIAAGFGVASFLPPGRPVPWVEKLGLALILGSGAISLMLFALGGVLQGGALVTAVAFIAGILGIAGRFESDMPNVRVWVSIVTAMFRRTAIISWRIIWRGAESITLPGSGLFIAALIPVLAVVGWQAANHPLTADGLFNFEIRAQLAALHGGHIPASFFSDATRPWTNPTYPLFLPLNETWIYLCVGGPHQGLAQLLSVHFVAGAACLLFAGVTRLTGDAWRGGLAVALLILLPNAMIVPGGALSLWADFPVAVVFLSALIYLVEFEATGGGLPLFAAFLALCPWVKREGMLLAGVLTIAFCWVAWRRGKIRQIPAVLLPLAIIVVGWKVFLITAHATVEKDFLPLSLGTALKNLDRIPVIIVMLARELVVWDRWTLLWPVTAVAMLLIARNPALVRWRLLTPIIAVLFALYSSIYIFSSWDSLVLHIGTSLPRLLLSVSMPAILAIAAATPRWDGGKRSVEAAPPA